MKNIQKTYTYTLEKLPEIVECLYKLLPEVSIFTFEGDLGAGKTTLVKALLKRCGVRDVITSPTFNYVNAYINTDGQTFYHYDLYRLNSSDEFFALGLEDFLYQPNSWAFIEWPGIIQGQLHDRVCAVKITYIDQNIREINIIS